MATDMQVRQALADSIDTISGIRGHAFTPGQVSPPAAIVIEIDVEFDASMQRGSDRMVALVRLLTGGDMRAAQARLSELVDEVRARIWDDPTLGDVVSDSRLRRKRGDTEGQVDAYGATFTVVDVEVEIIT